MKQTNEALKEYARREAERLANIAYEQMMIREEQARQAAILEEHSAALAHHEDRISKLEHRMAMAEREINHYKPMLEALEAEVKALDNKVWYFEQKGLPCSGIKKQLNQKQEQAYRIETKILNAEFKRDTILDEMA